MTIFLYTTFPLLNESCRILIAGIDIEALPQVYTQSAKLLIDFATVSLSVFVAETRKCDLSRPNVPVPRWIDMLSVIKRPVGMLPSTPGEVIISECIFCLVKCSLGNVTTHIVPVSLVNWAKLYLQGLLLQAVCCSDHEHCCPNGYTCHVEQGTCNKANGESISWTSKVKAISKVSYLNNLRR